MLNLIGIIFAFILVIVLIRRKFNFGISLIIGSLITGIFSFETIGLESIPKVILEAIIYNFDNKPFHSIIYNFDYNNLFFDTIELALLMTLIYLLAKLMQETGAIEKLIYSLRMFFSKGGTLAVIPAIYGLMPVPGGALFSAPMIDNEGNKFKINKDEKNFLNVWFRHIWFAIYPISSAMILICSDKFSNIDIYYLVIINLPAFVTSVTVGVIYLKSIIKKIPENTNKYKRNYSGLIYIFPPIIPLFSYILLQIINFSQIRSFIIGIIFSIIFLYFIINVNSRQFLIIIKKSLNSKLAIAIFGIMIFREMFEESGSTYLIADIIGNFPIPDLFIIIVIPIILGILTGYNLGAVALSYPLVEPFFKYSNMNILGLTSIIFISSLVGYLISPIHLCNVVSSNYMKTDTTRMYKMYVPLTFLILLVQTIAMILIFAD
jgi:integral membrane protein (TIGR00529 family)